jgi:hypothetical protein
MDTANALSCMLVSTPPKERNASRELPYKTLMLLLLAHEVAICNKALAQTITAYIPLTG